MAHTVDTSADNITAVSTSTQRIGHAEEQGQEQEEQQQEATLGSPFPISAVVHFQLQTQDSNTEDMVIGQYREAEHDYRSGTSLFRQDSRARESISSVISEPIDIPQSPLLPPEAPYLEVQDFSETEGTENSVWSSAFEPRQPPAHMLKWEAMVKRNKVEREQAEHGDEEADPSGSEEGDATRDGCDDDDDREELWWDMEM